MSTIIRPLSAFESHAVIPGRRCQSCAEYQGGYQSLSTAHRPKLSHGASFECVAGLAQPPWASRVSGQASNCTRPWNCRKISQIGANALSAALQTYPYFLSEFHPGAVGPVSWSRSWSQASEGNGVPSDERISVVSRRHGTPSNRRPAHQLGQKERFRAKASEKPSEPEATQWWHKPIIWAGGVGTLVVAGVLTGVLVNALSPPTQRLIESAEPTVSATPQVIIIQIQPVNVAIGLSRIRRLPPRR